MLLEFFLSVLGKWSREVIRWFNENPLNLILVYGSWMLVWAAGKLQLRRNVVFLEQSILSLVRNSLHNGEKVNIETIYAIVEQNWRDKFHQLAWFVPHKSELWPIPARFEEVKSRIGFSTQWVSDYLTKNNLLEGHK